MVTALCTTPSCPEKQHCGVDVPANLETPRLARLEVVLTVTPSAHPFVGDTRGGNSGVSCSVHLTANTIITIDRVEVRSSASLSPHVKSMNTERNAHGGMLGDTSSRGTSVSVPPPEDAMALATASVELVVVACRHRAPLPPLSGVAWSMPESSVTGIETRIELLKPGNGTSTAIVYCSGNG